MTGTMPKILPLENSYRLTRAELERRYNAMPNLKKAELIEGVVYRENIYHPVLTDVFVAWEELSLDR